MANLIYSTDKFMDKIFRLPLPVPMLFPVLAWVTGIMLARYIYLPMWLVLWTGLVLAVLALWGQRSKSDSTVLSIIGFVCLMMAISLSGFVRYNYTGVHEPIPAYMQERQMLIQVKAKVIRVDEKRCLLGNVQLNGKEIVLRLFLYNQVKLEHGDLVSFAGNLKVIEDEGNPEAFSYKEYCEFNKIGGIVYPVGRIVLTGRETHVWADFIGGLKTRIKIQLNKVFPENKEFATAMILGDKSASGLNTDLFIRAGLSHLLAVSGFNTGILYLILFPIFNIFIRNRTFCRILTIPFLLVFGALCDWVPSVSRAIIMLIVYILTKIFQRKASPNNILLVSLLVITLIEPRQLFSIGLQMSFAAVFVILNIIPEFSDLLIRSARNILLRPLVYVYILFVSTLLITLFIIPISIFYFHSINLNGLVGNLLTVPLSVILLPLALFCIILPQQILSIIPYNELFDTLYRVFLSWTEMSAGLPLYFQGIYLNDWFVPMFYGALIFLVLWWKRNACRWKSWYLGVGLLLLFLLPLAHPTQIAENRITFFNVGVGDCCLIETEKGSTVMIDNGPNSRTRGNIKYTVLPYLFKRQIKQIDYLIHSHTHDDHTGGYEVLQDNFKIKKIILNPAFNLKEYLTEKSQVLIVGDSLNIGFPELKIRLKYLYMDDTNPNDQVTLARVEMQNFSLLFAGDMEQDLEEKAIQSMPEFLDCDLLKIAHHGSRTSSTPEFIRTVSPQYALVSTSLHNKFRFPHKQTLKNLAFLKDRLFITGRDGAVVVRFDPQVRVEIRD